MENENVKVKKTPRGLIIGIAAAVVIIAVCVVLFILKPWASGYVGTVDNQKITKQEYMVFSKVSMNQFLSSIPNNTTTVDKYDWSQKVNGEAVKEQIKKETLNQIQENKIILIKAKEAGIKLSDEELKTIDELEKSITASGTKADAEMAIQDAFGISLSDYKKVYKGFRLAQKYNESERTNSKITVPEDEVKKYYNDYKKEFDKVTVTHILISTIDANQVPVSEGKKSEAKAKAEDLLKQVKAGADIKELAVKNSDDQPAVTTNKGEYTFARGEMAAEFEEWAFRSHTAGDAEIVETSYGYHVMQFEKREITPYDAVKENIKSSMADTKFIEDFSKKVEGWKKEKQFEIVKNDKVLEKTDLLIYRV